MHCNSCEMLIEESLEDNGVRAQISHKDNNVVVHYDEHNVSLKKIKQLIRNEGFEVM